jgi:PAS domain S-box-containing protein
LSPSVYYGKRLAEIEGVIIDPEAGRASIAAVKARQPYGDFIYAQKLPNGKTIWVNSSGAPFYGRDGVFLGYRGIARDVTAQVDAERAVREREQQFREMLEAAADYYWENDTQNRYTYLSPGFENLLGIPVTEMVGKGITDIPGVSIDLETARMGLQAKKMRQPFRDFVFSRKYADGKLRWFKTSGAAKFNPDGTFTGYRGVGAEITAHVEANQAARLGQQRLHEAVAHILQPLVIYDTEDRLVAFNQVFFDLLRAPNGDYARTGQSISFREITEWQLSHGFYTNGPGEPAVDLKTLLAHYQSEAEHTYHLRDGRWMLVVYRGLPGGGRLGLWTDITAVKRAEAEHRAFQHQFNHSQRLEALGTLAGGAAHEINNALVPVIALTKIMAAKQPEGSRERRNLDTVLTGAERSRDLVKQILAFSRKEDGEVRRDGVDLVAVLRDALKLMRATVPTSIALAEEITPAPLVAGDSNRLHQVIVNLVTNAAQAIGEAHGTITVGLRRDGDGAARFWVMDTGCGMDEATKARIFEPFFTTKAVGKGTGLGLSVVHGIIKEHGGAIEVESTPGRGTRFDVVLPAQTEQAGAAA